MMTQNDGRDLAEKLSIHDETKRNNNIVDIESAGNEPRSYQVEASAASADEATVGIPQAQRPDRELEKWRLAIILFCLCFALMLSALETNIVATALVDIASSLGDYQSSNWIVVSYLLTYTGFMIIYARVSDVLGRKPVILAAVAFFGIFSLGCGLVNDSRSLIILRAFQGMGGSGIYSMVFAVLPEIVPIDWFGVFSGVVGAVYACSSILGPILGGVISSYSAWRWVFLLNVPCTAIIFAVLLWSYPKPPSALQFSARNLLKIDWLGLILILAFSIFIVFALEQAGIQYPWNSGIVIGTLTVGVVLVLVFIVWEIALPRLSQNAPQPAFPLRLFRQRVLVAAFTSGFLFGIPFTVILIILPTRFQIVQGLTPLEAGIRMLPLLLSSAFGSGLGGAFARFRYGPTMAVIGGNAIAVLGMGLLSSVATNDSVRAREYGYLVLLGVSFGCSLSALIVVARTHVKPMDSAVLMAALAQIRVLGGCIGLAASSAIISARTGELASFLTSQQLEAVRDSAANIDTLPIPIQTQVRKTYGGAFETDFFVMLAVTGLAMMFSLGIWSRKTRTLADVKEEQIAWEKVRNETTAAVKEN